MKKINLPSYSYYANKTNHLFFKGFLWYEGELYQNSKELFLLLEKSKCLDSLNSCISFFKNVSGSFSIVGHQEFEGFYLVSDIIRTYPLFYQIVENDLCVTESINDLDHLEIDDSKLSAFISSGYVFGNHTIYQNANGIQAGEIVYFNKSLQFMNCKRYFKFIPYSDGKKIEKKDFVNNFNKISNQVFSNMVLTSLECNNWIVPLSGGHDSRQIINSLLKLGVKNVITFTYGRPGNAQALISQKVALKAGFEWHFIEYTEEKWKRLHDLGLIKNYSDFAFQGVSTPHLQDFLAVFELKEKGIIKKGDFFIPGHALDMIAGAHLSDIEFSHKDIHSVNISVAKKIGRNYREKEIQKSAHFKLLNEIFTNSDLKFQEFQEYINWQERQSKFIVNSCRVYEFFGFDFRLPFWDKRFVEFFLTLNREQRLERKFFLASERLGVLIPELASIPFVDELNQKQKKESIVIQFKKRIPNWARGFLIRLIGKKHYEAESLNQIFALQGKKNGDFLGPLKLYPYENRSFLRPIFIRPPHRADQYLLSGLYAVKKSVLDQNRL